MPENKTKLDPTRYPRSEQEGADEDNDLGGRLQSGRSEDHEVKPSKTDDIREDELSEGRRDQEDEEEEDEVTSRQPRIGG